MRLKESGPNVICFMCNFAFCQEDIDEFSAVNVARVNCVGELDPVLMLEAFEKGVDGLMLVGCRPPDCHFVEGNLHAQRAVKTVKKLLGLAGLEPERLKIVWYSPLNEKSLKNEVEEFKREIAKLGSSPLKNAETGLRLRINAEAAKNAASEFRLRVLLGREKELTEGVNVYSEKLTQEEFDTLLDDVVADEFVRNKIYLLTKESPLSVKDLAKATEMKPAEVLKQIVNMRRKNMISLDGIDGVTPVYKAVGVS